MTGRFFNVTQSLKGPINRKICLAFGLQLPIPWGFCNAGAGHMLLAEALRKSICMGVILPSQRLTSRDVLIQMPALSTGKYSGRANKTSESTWFITFIIPIRSSMKTQLSG